MGEIALQFRVTLVGIICLSGIWSAPFAWSQAYVPGEVIIKLKSEAGTSESYAFMGKAHSEKSMALVEAWGKLNTYRFALGKGQSVEQAIQDLRTDPEVLYVEPNYYMQKTAEVGLHQVYSSADVQAAAVSAQSSNVATSANIGVQSIWTDSTPMPSDRPIVAIIDTGLDTAHHVIADTDSLWTNPGEIPGNGLDDDNNGYVDDVHGWNFVDNNGTLYDDDGHGTHVSGIVLSVDQNIFTAPLRQSKIVLMPLKFLNGSGVGTTSSAIRAIYYAVNNGARVLNNSWGGSNYSSALHEAVAYSYTRGALFVAAAGNSAMNNDEVPMYPANYDVPNVISIAATTNVDYLASFSNYGPTKVHIGSPGVFILSSYPGDLFATSSGTSMAAPFVSGTAGQMKVVAPSMLGYQMKQTLMGQYNQVAQLSGRVSTSGRLSSSQSVTYSKTASIDATQPSYSIQYQPDRELASSIVGASGCGLVKKLSGGDGGGSLPSGGGGMAIAVLVLLVVPLLVLWRLRRVTVASRRRFERFKVDSDVRITVGGRELVGSVSSISLGGAQVNTAALLQDGGLVSLSITCPDGKEKVEVAGRVVWSEANKSYGVAFDHAPQSALSRIADWTRSLKRMA